MQRYESSGDMRPQSQGEGVWFGFRTRSFADRRREDGLVRAMAAEIGRAMEPRSRRSDVM